MFPDPQDALPLPPRPQVNQYRKLAKDLAKTARLSDPSAMEAWFERWFTELARLTQLSDQGKSGTAPEGLFTVSRYSDFANRLIPRSSQGTLAAAQFVLARTHGFTNWAQFAEGVDRLTYAGSTAALFESASDAIVNGEQARLSELLRDHPDLIQARSLRSHRATLLHYAGANGVENYRQKTPKNIVTIASNLLEAGAEIDATAEIYGGATTLGLVATSGHPEQAGVQIELMNLLLSHGASFDGSIGPDAPTIVHACLANNRPAAAEFLASKGAILDLATAAGLGRLDEARAMLDRYEPLQTRLVNDQFGQAFLWACSYNRLTVVQYWLGLGVDPGVKDCFGQTGLHQAAMKGNEQITSLLIAHNAPLEVENCYGGTPLGQALWSASRDRDPDRFLPTIRALLTAGSSLPTGWSPISTAINQVLAGRGSK